MPVKKIRYSEPSIVTDEGDGRVEVESHSINWDEPSVSDACNLVRTLASEYDVEISLKLKEAND